MPTFQSRKYIPSSSNNTLAVRYRASLTKHPFVLFGLPFLFTIVAGSFFLTPATAMRYERHDRKVRQMTEDERLGLKNTVGRKVSAESAAEEYYVSFCCAVDGRTEDTRECWADAVMGCSDWRLRTWMIGSRRGLSGCRGSMMGFSEDEDRTGWEYHRACMRWSGECRSVCI